jgi:hypothetical protein
MNAPPENPVGQGRAEDGRPRLEPDSLLVDLMPKHADEGRTMATHGSPAGAERRLIPRRPPGRCNRKAGSFSAEIRRLRAEGYSLDVIREALAAAGVVVSTSTVQREAARGKALSGSGPTADTSP